MNNYAISTSDLADSLTRSSASLVAANNSIEEAVALTTAANTISQDPEAVGSALKTVSMRIRGVKTELEEAGESTEGMITNTSKLQAKVKALTNVDGEGGINILTESGDFKSTYQILLEISKVWDKMSDTSQASLLEIIAGKNRGSVVAGIFQNGDILENAYKDASNADGSAMEELDVHLNSIQGRIELLNNAIQTMWMNFMKSDALKVVIDLATWLVKAADAIGPLGVAISALVAKTAFKGDSFMHIFDKNKAAMKAQEWVNGLTSAQKRQATVSKSAAKATMATATAQNTMGRAAKAASFGVSLLNSALTMGLSLAISFIVGKIVDYYDKINVTAEEIAEKADEIRDAYKSESSQANDNISTLRGLESEYNKLSKCVDEYGNNISLSVTDYERYKDIIQTIIGISPSLVEGYNAEGDAIVKKNELLKEAIKLEEDRARAAALAATTRENLETIAADAKNKITEAESAVKPEYATNKFAGDVVKSNTLAYNLAAGIGKDKFGHIDYIELNKLLNQLNPDGIEGTYSDIANHYSAKYKKSGIYPATAILYDFVNEYYDEIMADLSSENSVLKPMFKNKKYLEAALDPELMQAYRVSQLEVEKQYQSVRDMLLQVPLADADGTGYYAMSDNKKTLSALQNYVMQYIKRMDVDLDNINDAKVEIQNLTSFLTNNADAKSFLDTGTALQQGMDADGNILKMSDWMKAAHTLYKDIANADYTEDQKKVFDTMFGDVLNNNHELWKVDDHIENLLTPTERDGAQDAITDWIDSLSTQDALLIYYNISAEPNSLTLPELQQQLVDLKKSAAYVDITPIKTPTNIKSDIDAYNESLDKTAEIAINNTEVTQEYKDALIDLGISKDKLNEYFHEDNELLVKNAHGLNELVKSTKNNIAQNIKLAKSHAMIDYYELYNQMRTFKVESTKSYDAIEQAAIDSLFSQMNAIEQTIAKYSMLEAKLLGAADAYDRLAAAQEADSEMDYGSKAEELVNVLYESFKSNELGTQAAQVAIDGLIPDSVIEKAETLDDKMRAIYQYLTGGEVSKLFTVKFDDDGNLSSIEMTQKNVQSFFEQLKSKNFFDTDGNDLGTIFTGSWDEFTLNPQIKTLEDFAKACGITKEVAFAFLTELERYDISWLGGDYTTLLDQLMGNDLEYQLYNRMEKIANIEKKMADNKATQDDYTQHATLLKEQADLEANILDNVVGWASASDKLKEAEDEIVRIKTEMADADENTPEYYELTEQLKNAESVAADLIADMKELNEPTEFTLQVAADEVQEQIQNIKDKADDLGISVAINEIDTKGISGLGFEKGADGTWIGLAEWDVYTNLNEDGQNAVKEYLNLIDQKHTIDVLIGEGITTIEEHLQNIVDILQQTYELQVQTQVDKTNVDSFIDWLGKTKLGKVVDFTANKIGNWLGIDNLFSGGDDKDTDSTKTTSNDAVSETKEGSTKTKWSNGKNNTNAAPTSSSDNVAVNGDMNVQQMPVTGDIVTENAVVSDQATTDVQSSAQTKAESQAYARKTNLKNGFELASELDGNGPRNNTDAPVVTPSDDRIDGIYKRLSYYDELFVHNDTEDNIPTISLARLDNYMKERGFVQSADGKWSIPVDETTDSTYSIEQHEIDGIIAQMQQIEQQAALDPTLSLSISKIKEYGLENMGISSDSTGQWSGLPFYLNESQVSTLEQYLNLYSKCNALKEWDFDAWLDSTQQITEAKQRVEQLNSAIESGDMSSEEYADELKSAGTIIEESLKDLSGLYTPTDSIVFGERDKLQQEIENFKNEYANDWVMTPVINEVNSDNLYQYGLTKDANGNWSGILQLKAMSYPIDDDPTIQEYLNLLDKQHTIDVLMGDGIITFEEHLASIIDVLLQTYKIQVKADVDSSNVDSFVSWLNSTSFGKTVSFYAQTVGSVWDKITSFFGGKDVVDGTAHARGTAYKSGSWGAPKTETALTGELGPELV